MATSEFLRQKGKRSVWSLSVPKEFSIPGLWLHKSSADLDSFTLDQGVTVMEPGCATCVCGGLEHAHTEETHHGSVL